MTAIWRALRGAGLAPPPDEPWTCQNMVRAYAEIKDDVLAEARAELGERRTELTTLTRQLAKAKTEAVIIALTEQMERLGEQIAELEQRTRPLDEIMAASRADLEEAAEKVRLARQAIAGDANRRKTEALQRLLRESSCDSSTSPLAARSVRGWSRSRSSRLPGIPRRFW